MRLQYGMKLAVAILTLFVAGNCAAETGEAVYRDKCAMCHDAGTDKAPRIEVREDWKARFSKGREGLVRSAIKGLPGTAMTPKAGFTQLPDAEVAGAVDYMLARLGFNPEDVALARNVLDALERVGIHGVRAEAVDGAVLLTGVAEDQAAVSAAVAAARAVPGVREVENRVEPAQLFK
jgi:cytochrome c5